MQNECQRTEVILPACEFADDRESATSNLCLKSLMSIAKHSGRKQKNSFDQLNDGMNGNSNQTQWYR
jgi:hypothetical protein